MRKAGFSAVPYHNQVPTMGQWGWVLGADAGTISESRLADVVQGADYSDIPTMFLNRDAVISMTHFGKGVLDEKLLADIATNTELNPTLYRYYNRGSWGVY